MTALTSHRVSTTPVDRALLRAASALDRFVETRLERRSTVTGSPETARHDSSRTAAQALGAIGILPR